MDEVDGGRWTVGREEGDREADGAESMRGCEGFNREWPRMDTNGFCGNQPSN